MILNAIIIFLFALVPVSTDYRSILPRTSNFCEIKCGWKKHICCIYGYDFGPKCYTRPILQHIGEMEKEAIVDIINSIRNEVASGNASRGDLRRLTASNMHSVSYSRKLEYTASCWAKQCIPHHSRCRSIEDGRLGETICVSHGFTRRITNFSENLFLQCPRNMMKQFPEFSMSIIDQLALPTFGDDEKHRESVQLIWARTRFIGCSRVVYPHNRRGFSNVLIVCHFFPSGNVLEAPIFLLLEAPR
ncbi:Cysteine-rich secretory protein family [Popillia japonica]|uniref:Cysteine-rich secretory protein family n=1 Tax=Popillia japonica TaxID=7064 RepID=A0AAW1KQQ2_POPJA